MNPVIEDKHWQNGSFTVGFSFSGGIAFCEGFITETLISKALELKYQMLVKHPVEGGFWTMKHMEEPMTQREISEAIEKFHRGSIAGKEFLFKVFDRAGYELFGTRFDVTDKIPSEGLASDKLVVTSFTWSYKLPDALQTIAKNALEEHFNRIKK